MIVTVTMNPAIDKTALVEEFVLRGLNRLQSVKSDAGGKGINVSKTIRELGGTSLATGFLGGQSGRTIAEALTELGIEHDFVYIKGETRVNLKVTEPDGSLTELNEVGPEPGAEAIEELMEKLEKLAAPGVTFVLGGSIPRGVPTDIYKRIIETVHAKDAKVFLDADGPLFAEALKANPDYIKPNRFELEQYFELDHEATEADLIELSGRLLSTGVKQIAVSLGGEGALFIGDGHYTRIPGLKVEVKSTVGAGDAMVAALVYSYDTGISPDERVLLAMATSAGACMTEGTQPPTREQVDTLLSTLEPVVWHPTS